MITVLVVDDQELLRRGLRLLLGTVSGISVVAEAGDGHEALAMINKHDPDVVLTDARMDGMDGVTLIAEVARRHPGLPVLMLTTFDDDDALHGSLTAGAAGFLLKDISPERLAEAVEAAYSGQVVIDPRLTRRALAGPSGSFDDDALALLTRAERAVAREVAAGKSNAQIAEALVIAEGTVKNHVSSLLHKLAQPHRTAMALFLYDYFDRPERRS
jgi:DNA-binding NarL/FixJ family response regulator